MLGAGRVPRKHVDGKRQRRQRHCRMLLSCENTSVRLGINSMCWHSRSCVGKDASGIPKTFAFEGVTPAPETNAAHRSRVAILLKPLAVNAIGPALVHGRMVMPIDVIDTAHTRARVLANHKLQSGYFGPVRILAATATGDAKQCICYVDSFDGGHCWVRVPSGGIAAGTFTAPTTTSCVLAWPGTTSGLTNVTGANANVNVVNYGPKIEFTTGKFVRCTITAGRLIPDVEYCD